MKFKSKHNVNRRTFARSPRSSFGPSSRSEGETPPIVDIEVSQSTGSNKDIPTTLEGVRVLRQRKYVVTSTPYRNQLPRCKLFSKCSPLVSPIKQNQEDKRDNESNAENTSLRKGEAFHKYTTYAQQKASKHGNTGGLVYRDQLPKKAKVSLQSSNACSHKKDGHLPSEHPITEVTTNLINNEDNMVHRVTNNEIVQVGNSNIAEASTEQPILITNLVEEIKSRRQHLESRSNIDEASTEQPIPIHNLVEEFKSRRQNLESSSNFAEASTEHSIPIHNLVEEITSRRQHLESSSNIAEASTEQPIPIHNLVEEFKSRRQNQESNSNIAEASTEEPIPVHNLVEEIKSRRQHLESNSNIVEASTEQPILVHNLVEEITSRRQHLESNSNIAEASTEQPIQQHQGSTKHFQGVCNGNQTSHLSRKLRKNGTDQRNEIAQSTASDITETSTEQSMSILNLVNDLESKKREPLAKKACQGVDDKRHKSSLRQLSCTTRVAPKSPFRCSKEQMKKKQNRCKHTMALLEMIAIESDRFYAERELLSRTRKMGKGENMSKEENSDINTQDKCGTYNDEVNLIPLRKLRSRSIRKPPTEERVPLNNIVKKIRTKTLNLQAKNFRETVNKEIQTSIVSNQNAVSGLGHAAVFRRSAIRNSISAVRRSDNCQDKYSSDDSDVPRIFDSLKGENRLYNVGCSILNNSTSVIDKRPWRFENGNSSQEQSDNVSLNFIRPESNIRYSPRKTVSCCDDPDTSLANNLLPTSNVSLEMMSPTEKCTGSNTSIKPHKKKNYTRQVLTSKTSRSAQQAESTEICASRISNSNRDNIDVIPTELHVVTKPANISQKPARVETGKVHVTSTELYVTPATNTNKETGNILHEPTDLHPSNSHNTSSNSCGSLPNDNEPYNSLHKRQTESNISRRSTTHPNTSITRSPSCIIHKSPLIDELLAIGGISEGADEPRHSSQNNPRITTTQRSKSRKGRKRGGNLESDFTSVRKSIKKNINVPETTSDHEPTEKQQHISKKTELHVITKPADVSQKPARVETGKVHVTSTELNVTPSSNTNKETGNILHEPTDLHPSNSHNTNSNSCGSLPNDDEPYNSHHKRQTESHISRRSTHPNKSITKSLSCIIQKSPLIDELLAIGGISEGANEPGNSSQNNPRITTTQRSKSRKGRKRGGNLESDFTSVEKSIKKNINVPETTSDQEPTKKQQHISKKTKTNKLGTTKQLLSKNDVVYPQPVENVKKDNGRRTIPYVNESNILQSEDGGRPQRIRKKPRCQVPIIPPGFVVLDITKVTRIGRLSKQVPELKKKGRKSKMRGNSENALVSLTNTVRDNPDHNVSPSAPVSSTNTLPPIDEHGVQNEVSEENSVVLDIPKGKRIGRISKEPKPKKKGRKSKKRDNSENALTSLTNTVQDNSIDHNVSPSASVSSTNTLLPIEEHDVQNEVSEENSVRGRRNRIGSKGKTEKTISKAKRKGVKDKKIQDSDPPLMDMLIENTSEIFEAASVPVNPVERNEDNTFADSMRPSSVNCPMCPMCLGTGRKLSYVDSGLETSNRNTTRKYTKTRTNKNSLVATNNVGRGKTTGLVLPGSLNSLQDTTDSQSAVLDTASNGFSAFPAISNLGSESDLDQIFTKRIFDGNVYNNGYIGRVPLNELYQQLGNIYVHEVVKDPGNHCSIGYLRLQSGNEKRPNSGSKFSFTYLVVSGIAEVQINDKPEIVTQGEFFWIPKGTKYSFKSANSQELIISYVKIQGDMK